MPGVQDGRHLRVSIGTADPLRYRRSIIPGLDIQLIIGQTSLLVLVLAVPVPVLDLIWCEEDSDNEA